MQLLLAEDEQKTIDYLTKGLREDGHAVDAMGNGADALALALAGEFDAIMRDVMLPGLDSSEVLKRLRAAGRSTPVLFLTARDHARRAFVSGGLDARAETDLVIAARDRQHAGIQLRTQLQTANSPWPYCLSSACTVTVERLARI